MRKNDVRGSGSPLMYIVGAILAVGVYVYGSAVNRGVISRDLNSLVNGCFFVVAAIVFVVYVRVLERRALGDALSGKFEPQANERVLFDGNFLSGEFYPDSGLFKATRTMQDLVRRRPFTVHGLLRMRLTQDRIVAGSAFGYTWRVIPIRSAKWSVQHVRGTLTKSDALLMEYPFQDHNEAILVWLKGRKERELVAMLQRVAYPSG